MGFSSEADDADAAIRRGRLRALMRHLGHRQGKPQVRTLALFTLAFRLLQLFDHPGFHHCPFPPRTR